VFDDKSAPAPGLQPDPLQHLDVILHHAAQEPGLGFVDGRHLMVGFD
jgi:hypothetical protein